MSKTMLVNVTHVEESRVAVLDNGVLAAYDIETINRTSIKGNIYNAIVETVHPSLEAAFLRISSELKGFLPLDEVNFKLLPTRTEDRSRGRIGQHLHQGQRIMAQVVREPFAGKPPTVSTYFSLPGRFLVLMPGVDTGGISRKIADSTQRDRLKKIVEELQPPEGFGLIVRTAGIGQTKVELQRDLRYLLRLWESIQRSSGATDFPGLVYQERDLVIRTIRDHFTPDIDEVWIDNPETYEHALEFVRDVMPTKSKNIKLYSGDRPLFNKYNLEEQIERIYKRRVPLPSGGEIVIDGTEALTAIDVNSARSSRQGDAEENATQTNLEAASEIARQLRLRDLGGLVVVDFIDMAASRNQKKVEKAMRDAMKGDKAKYDVTRISKLGLMEVSRQRIKGEKMAAMYTTCPACEGYGLIKNVEAAALSALRKLQTRCTRGGFGRLRLGLPPEVATWILNHKREEIVHLESRHDIDIVVEPKLGLLRHENEFETFAREKAEPAPAPAPAADERAAISLPSEPAAAPKPPEAEETAPAESEEGAPSGSGRRRRRRRRRGSGAKAPSETGEGAAPEEKPAPDESDDDAIAAGDVDIAGDADAGADESEGDVAEDSPAAESEEGTSSGGRKRRRRRRRRGRGSRGARSDDEATTASGADGAPAAEASGGDDEDTPEVPSHVRADELMPAAAAYRDGRGGGRRRSRRDRAGTGGPKEA